MTNGFALLAHRSVRQKTKPHQFSSVQLRRSVRAIRLNSSNLAAGNFMSYKRVYVGYSVLHNLFALVQLFTATR